MSWDRAAVAALPLVFAVAVVTSFFGGTPELAVPVAAGVVLVIGVVARRIGRRAAVEHGWAPPAPREDVPRRPRGSVSLALAGVELRELLLSGWFLAGAGFCVLFLVGITGFERSWWGTAALMPLLVHPLCGLTIVAVHRNVTRASRDRTDDLYRSCPATGDQRMRAHLLVAAAPITAAAMFLAASLVGAAIALDHIYGPLDTRVATDVVIAALLLPAGATALGVLLGRRIRFTLAPILVVGAIALVNLEFWDEPDGRGWLVTGRGDWRNDLVYVDPPSAGRLAWIGGLVVVVTAAAVWAGRRRRAVLMAAPGAGVAIAGIVLVGLAPSDAAADRLAGYVLGEERYTTCTKIAPEVDVCVPNPYRDHGAAIAATIAPVAAAIPDGALARPVTLQFVVDDRDMLQRPVRERLPYALDPPGVVPLMFAHRDDAFGVARFDLAAAAVGIPYDAPSNVLVDGQARGVVMLWLATAGLDRTETRAVLQPGNLSDSSWRGHIWPGMCGADVQWAPQDLVAARMVVSLDRTATAAVLTGEWERWIDPATTTDELVTALGLPSAGPSEPIRALVGDCI